MIRYFSPSEMRSYLRCKRQWWLRYYRRQQPGEGGSAPQNVGNFVHYALHQLYTPNPTMTMVDAIHKMHNEQLERSPEFEELLGKNRDLAIQMVNGYLEWVVDKKVDDGLEIYASEEKIQAPLGDTGYGIEGTLDARALNKFDGSKVIIDHKTVDDLKMLQKNAQLDGQFLTYHLLEFLQDNGDFEEKPRVDAVLINQLRRVWKIPAAKPPFYERFEVRHNVNELRNHWYHVLEIARNISQTEERLDNGELHHRVVPPTPDKSCNWGCSFRPVCPMFDDGSDAEGFMKYNYSIGIRGGSAADIVEEEDSTSGPS